MTEPLITLQDIRELKSISLNLKSEKELEPHIMEAQNFDLRPFLGDTFYLALVEDLNASPSLQEFADLWNGSTYQYGGETFIQEGLKAMLIYNSYARYLPHSNVQTTATGLVHKVNQYSERVEDKTVSRLVVQARSSAQTIQDRVKCFLDRNNGDYPLWKFKGKKGKYTSGMRVRSIG